MASAMASQQIAEPFGAYSVSILNESEKPVRKEDRFDGLWRIKAQLFTSLRAEHLTWMESRSGLSGLQQDTWP